MVTRGTFCTFIIRSHFIFAVLDLDVVYSCIFKIYKSRFLENVSFMKKYILHIERKFLYIECRRLVLFLTRLSYDELTIRMFCQLLLCSRLSFSYLLAFFFFFFLVKSFASTIEDNFWTSTIQWLIVEYAVSYHCKSIFSIRLDVPSAFRCTY